MVLCRIYIHRKVIPYWLWNVRIFVLGIFPEVSRNFRFKKLNDIIKTENFTYFDSISDRSFSEQIALSSVNFGFRAKNGPKWRHWWRIHKFYSVHPVDNDQFENNVVSNDDLINKCWQVRHPIDNVTSLFFSTVEKVVGFHTNWKKLGFSVFHLMFY